MALVRSPSPVVAVVAAVLITACAIDGRPDQTRAAGTRGEALFVRHCAVCHGFRGQADGPVATFLRPAPRDFALGEFNLVSTRNGMPTDRDLVETLRRGMPGSSMPAYGWMSDSDLFALAREVRQLAIDGWIARSLERSSPGTSLQSATERAVLRMMPMESVQTVLEVEPTEETLARGGELFLSNCAACHGEEGRGRRPIAHWQHEDRYTWARDFTTGILKGAGNHGAISARILAGMPAAGMPPFEFEDPEDLPALVGFVRSLIRPGTADRLVHARRTMTVRRVTDKLPIDPDDPRWETVRVVLAPLVWKDGAILEASVAFLHDGEEFAMLIRWQDPTRNDSPVLGSGSPDGVAVQFSAEKNPPVFAMGAHHEPVHIWHWKPFDRGDTAGLLDLLQNPPHADYPVYRSSPTHVALAGMAEGPSSAQLLADAGLTVRAAPQWRNGTWSVILRRPLTAMNRGEMAFVPGQPLSVAFAIWNGSAGDHRGEKSTTIWHDLIW